MQSDDNPIQMIMKHYPTMSKHDIMMEVGSWFYVNGKEEFDKATKSGLIKQNKEDSELWELA